MQNSSDILRLAVFQMMSVARNVADATNHIDQACAKAKAHAADLVIFPEMALTGYNIGANRARILAEPCDGPMILGLREMAAQHGIGILCGFPEADGDRVFNAVTLIDRTGTILATCRKTHLYGDVDRAQFDAADSLTPVVQFDDWSFGLAICYDVEFPEVVRAYALAGVDAVLVPTANMLPYTGVATRIVPARAEENEIYVAYANRVGSEGAFDYCGLSCVVGPDGIDLARATDSEEMIFADLSKETLANVRKTISHLEDRRPDLYS